MIYHVLSVDMWGHVPADCPEYACPCMVNGMHDDGACDCHEDCNDMHRVGTIEVSDDASAADIIAVLFSEGWLSSHGRDVCAVEDYNGMGEDLVIADGDGRWVFMLRLDDA